MSDLRRFWGIKSDEIDSLSYDDLEAFYDTLPAESATITKRQRAKLSMELVMLARISDNLTALQHTMGGKGRLNKDHLITDNFLAEGESSHDKSEAFKERIRRKRVYEKLLS